MRSYNEQTIKNQTKKDELLDNEEFSKFIINAKDPMDDDQRFIKKLKGLEEFDYVTFLGDDLIEGMHNKRFVMLDNSYYKDYLKLVKLKGGGNHYISYLNEEDINNGIYPSHFSTLIKAVSSNAEEPASRILNFFGVNTVFNKRIKTQSKEFLISLDCIKPNNYFIPIRLVTRLFNSKKSNVENLLINFGKTLSVLIENIVIENNLDTVNVDIDKIKREIVKSYLVRNYILADSDFIGNRNFALLYNESEKKIDTAFNFDFEYSLNFFYDTQYLHNLKLAVDDFKFIKKKYAAEFKEFYNKFEKFIQSDKKFMQFYEKILIKDCKLSPEETKRFSFVLGKNAEFIKMVYEELEYGKLQRQ